ncbi:MAG TPA: hypothetical protein VMF07_06430 [Solirubrobacteraceae bacterium]|nr:hypothetical protein [Solirubrobacteraceae bacterium]
MSLLPSVEQELMRVARAPAGGAAARGRVRRVGRRRLPGAVLAVAVSVVALLVGAGFLVALRGAGGGAGSVAQRTPPPRAGGGQFPGAPHTQRPDNGLCRRAPRNRYLPREVGCVSVRRADIVGGDHTDLLVLYARLGRRTSGGYLWRRFTLELIRPSGQSTRLRLGYTDAFPYIARIGNLNGVPGDELVLHLDDISSGDTYGIVTFSRGRLVLVRPLLSAGGDSVYKEGFTCGNRHRSVVSTTMVLLNSQPVDGRWRWSVRTYAWLGARLRETRQHSFVRRGLPGRRDTPAGAGCGRPTGATQSHPG